MTARTPGAQPEGATTALARLDLAARAKLEADLLRRRRRTHETIPVLPRPAEGEARFPASLSQEGAWATARARPRPTPVVLGGMRLHGRLDAEDLERALNMVAARHETLRTVLRPVAGQLTQVISPAAHLTVPISDGTLADFDELTWAEVDRPLDLEHGPLIRLRLLRLHREDHIAILVFHHAIADARATEVFFADLAAAYLGLRAGQQVSLPPLPLQYADFALWQRARLTGSRCATQIGYWAQRLAGAAPVPLPSDSPAPDQPPERGDALVCPLPDGLLAGLRGCALGHGTTVFVAALAVFQILLARYSGLRDISVPVPVTLRDRPELQDLISDFSHTMVCRADLSGDPSFASLLAQVWDAFARDLEHADLPPHLLAPHLPDPTVAEELLNGLEFSTDHEAAAEIPGTELRAEPMPPRWQYALRPLTVRLAYGSDRAQLILTYRRRDLSVARVGDLARDYLDVMAACVGRPLDRVLGPDAPALRVPRTHG